MTVVPLAFLAGLGCTRSRDEQPAGLPTVSPGPSAILGSSAEPTVPRELLPPPKPSSSTPKPPASASAPWTGPWFVVTRAAAGILSEPSFDAEKKLGYVRNGGRIAVKGKTISGNRCSGGWYEVVGGGMVCGNLGTVDPNSAELKLLQTQPSLDEILPYQYARNAKNGTPLYHSVPTAEQMDHYEPYRVAAARGRNENGSVAGEESDGPSAVGDGDAGVETAPPWWQQDAGDAKLNELTLTRLKAEADDVLAMRLVQGFYIAVDRAFRWHDRGWYKTTQGLVAPADRFWRVAAPTFKGVALDSAEWKLPIAWVYGGRKNTSGYGLDEKGETLRPAKTFEAFSPILLTGNRRELNGTLYYETSEQLWIKAAHVRTTHPADPPADLDGSEHWFDINLTEQTLVAFEGKKPVYATLVSTGKKSKIKEKDHSTPVGQWRVREKHLTTTMDGDGTAAGDLPYSIEDVPYVVYFHRSYAVHGAFWHKNFGSRMSHGCVNLSPLDARWVFSFAAPELPPGWHGVWATAERLGSRIVVHD